MRGMNPHIEEFLENCREAKARVEADEELMAVSRGELPFYGSLSIGEKVRIKKKDRGLGFTEVVITADIFDPTIPSSSYVMVVSSNNSVFKLTYLVEDFGDIRELKLGGCPYALEPEFERITEHLRERGYETRGDELVPFCLDSDKKLRVHVLDAKPFYGMEYIIEGAKRGIGPYAHLRRIWGILTSEEYRLNI